MPETQGVGPFSSSVAVACPKNVYLLLLSLLTNLHILLILHFKKYSPAQEASMTDLTYRGAAHHGDRNVAPSKDVALSYRGASYHSAEGHKDKPRASRAGLRYRGAPQHG